MAITNSVDDYELANDCGTQGNWTGIDFDQPQLNDTNSTTPIYVESSTCMFWPLKKGVTNGRADTSTLPANMDIDGKVFVGFLQYPFADIDNIPITAFSMRVSSSTSPTSNYRQWDALAQLNSPENTPISGFTPVMGYSSGGTTSGTPNMSDIESFAWVATAGNGADGKQGGFDHIFAISYVGAHSETFTNTFFSDLYNEWYDNNGGGLPGTANRPIGVLSTAGDFYQTNVRFALGDGASDTANIVVDETGKTIFFNNLESDHELGYRLTNPASTHELRLTLTNCVHLWNDQSSANEIFDGVTNCDYFRITGCSFTNGGIVSLPSDNANRYVRNSTFQGCQTGNGTDSEFTSNVVSGCLAFTFSGDADLTGSSFLEPTVAVDASGLVWNGNFDPDGNLDNMIFTKGANAHHAIAFGTGSPLTMTLRGIDFGTSWNASHAQNDSTLHILRTSGTVTINLVDCAGTISYKSAGATVNLVVSPVTVTVNVKDEDSNNLQNARIFLETAATVGGGEIFEAAVTSITRSGSTATCTTTAAHGLETNDYVVIRGSQPDDYNRVAQITVSSTTVFTYTVTGTPTTPATGTPVVSYVLISALTDVSGNAAATRSFGANQSYKGWARLKNASSPFYKDANIATTVSSTADTPINLVLLPDE